MNNMDKAFLLFFGSGVVLLWWMCLGLLYSLWAASGLGLITICAIAIPFCGMCAGVTAIAYQAFRE